MHHPMDLPSVVYLARTIRRIQEACAGDDRDDILSAILDILEDPELNARLARVLDES